MILGLKDFKVKGFHAGTLRMYFLFSIRYCLETNKGIYVFDDIANRRQSNFRIKWSLTGRLKEKMMSRDVAPSGRNTAQQRTINRRALMQPGPTKKGA